jgi:hypothetical protein
VVVVQHHDLPGTIAGEISGPGALRLAGRCGGAHDGIIAAMRSPQGHGICHPRSMASASGGSAAVAEHAGMQIEMFGARMTADVAGIRLRAARKGWL